MKKKTLWVTQEWANMGYHFWSKRPKHKNNLWQMSDFCASLAYVCSSAVENYINFKGFADNLARNKRIAKVEVILREVKK